MQTKPTKPNNPLTFNDVYLNEKRIMFSDMDKHFKGWRLNKKTVNRVKQAAKQSAENMWYALKIGQQVNVPAKEVLRIAMLMRVKHGCSIGLAFDKINTRLKHGEEWDSIVKGVMK